VRNPYEEQVGTPSLGKARDVCREVRMSDEGAGFREAESEERIEQDFLAGEIAA
jgi:hypothetical protein